MRTLSRLRLTAPLGAALALATPAHAVNIRELWDFSDPARSEQRFQAALGAAQGDLRLELETQIARTYSLRKRFEDAHRLLDSVEARALFVQARELGRKAGEEDLAIDAAHMVAIAEGGEKALQWNLMALPLAANARDPQARRWRAPLLHNIGYELKELGRYDEALKYFRQALAAYEERGNPRNIRVAHWMVAHTLRLLGKYDEALAIQLRLKAEWDAAGEQDEYVLREIAELNKALGR